MKKLIIFLIRKRLGLKKGVRFRFTNQKDRCFYYFDNEQLNKEIWSKGRIRVSDVSLNWLLSDDCRIEVFK